jgi:hypothetical protein
VVIEDPDLVVTVDYPAVCLDFDPRLDCYTGPQASEWSDVGKPGCWCSSGHVDANPRQCHGDAARDAQGRYNYWTSTNDLAVLLAAWNLPYADIAGVEENGIPLICADFDHLPQGRYDYRVSTNDLAILIANWNLNNLPDPTCP